MARRTYRYGDQTFTSKQAARKYTSALAHRYRDPPGLVSDPGDDAFMRAVLKQHPRAAIYEALGVAGFMTWTEPVYGTLGMRVVLADGTSDAFSYLVSLGIRTDNSHISKVFREHISPQTRSWKAQQFATPPVYCAMTGVELDWTTGQVDHVYPDTFSSLLKEFLAREVVGEVEFEEAPEGIGSRIKDRQLATAWEEFHQQRARYRMLLGDVNSKLGNRKEDP